MPTKAVRYTQPLLGVEPGSHSPVLVDPDQLTSVLIRQNGAACTVYGSNAKAALANPIPLGVASGSAGVSTLGELLVYFEAGKGYDALVTAGGEVTVVPLPDISPDVADVQASAEAGTTIGSGSVVDDEPVVTYATKWGITALGVPYYDEDGAAPGEEAILVASHFVNQGGVPYFSTVPVLTLIPIASA